MRAVFCLIALAFLAACGGAEKGGLSEPLSSEAAYRHDGAPALTLITVINNRSGAGGHSALMVSGSQRVIFDPAGSFRHEMIPEYGDVIYGVTPGRLANYQQAHARSTYHVVLQEIEVSPDVAEEALALVQANGTVGSAFCANATSSILQQLPGFDDVTVTFFPNRLMEQLAQRSDVSETRYYENDAGDVVDAVTALALSEDSQ